MDKAGVGRWLMAAGAAKKARAYNRTTSGYTRKIARRSRTDTCADEESSKRHKQTILPNGRVADRLEEID